MQSSWKEYQLSKIINIIGGGTPRKNIDEYWNGNIPWLSVVDFNNDNRKVNQTTEKITELGLQKSSTKILDTNQIIISARGTVGALAQVSEPMAFNQSCYGLNAKTEYTNNDFLYYLVKYKISHIKNITHGAVFDTITRDTFNYISVNLPPLKTQKKIVNILSVLDDKIELNRKMNETLEEMAQALFKSWFVDFDPVHALQNRDEEDLETIASNLGISKEVLELFPSEFEESELGMIPKGWEVERFGNTIEKYIDNRGKTPPTVEDGIPLLEVRNMPDSMLTSNPAVTKFVTEDTYNNWFRSYLEENDILISTVGTIGKTCIVPKNSKIAIAQNVLGLRFKSDILESQFMFYQMKSKQFLNDIDARLVITVQASIKRKDLDTIDVIVPPKGIQELFIKQVQPIIEKQQSNENINLEKTRDTLLPKLLSGEIEV